MLAICRSFPTLGAGYGTSAAAEALLNRSVHVPADAGRGSTRLSAVPASVRRDRYARRRLAGRQRRQGGEAVLRPRNVDRTPAGAARSTLCVQGGFKVDDTR